MARKIDIAPLAIVIGIAIILQLALIAADSVKSPAKTAREFAEAYFYLSPDMQEYLCSDLAKGDSVVNDFLYQKRREASELGFSTNFLRKKFTEIHLAIISSGKDTAKIHLTGTTRVCINPAFMVIGKLFGIGQNYPVDATLDMVRQDGRWRVCGNPFGIRHQI